MASLASGAPLRTPTLNGEKHPRHGTPPPTPRPSTRTPETTNSSSFRCSAAGYASNFIARLRRPRHLDLHNPLERRLPPVRQQHLALCWNGSAALACYNRPDRVEGGFHRCVRSSLRVAAGGCTSNGAVPALTSIFASSSSPPPRQRMRRAPFWKMPLLFLRVRSPRRAPVVSLSRSTSKSTFL